MVHIKGKEKKVQRYNLGWAQYQNRRREESVSELED